MFLPTARIVPLDQVLERLFHLQETIAGKWLSAKVADTQNGHKAKLV
jgi:hypothetical protein